MHDRQIRATLDRHWAASEADDLEQEGQICLEGSIMEFLGGKVTLETQYSGEPFEPGPSRAKWLEHMP